MIETKRNKKSVPDGLKILDEITGNDPDLRRLIDAEKANLEIAKQIYELRAKAKLSQADLAEKIGTTQSVISRLEDSDYDGHSLAMLQRIASALNRRIEIRFVPLRQRAQVA